MPRFSFHIARDGSPHPFELELRDLDTVRHIALKTACGMIQERSSEFWANGGEWQMTVADERGKALFKLTFLATEGAAC